MCSNMMDLEGKSYKEDIYHMISLIVESKKYNKLMNITKKKQTHRYGDQTNGYHWDWGAV